VEDIHAQLVNHSDANQENKTVLRDKLINALKSLKAVDHVCLAQEQLYGSAKNGVLNNTLYFSTVYKYSLDNLTSEAIDSFDWGIVEDVLIEVI